MDRIGKKSGVLICGTPKYLHARSESNLEYAALAGRVQGGLFPGSVRLVSGVACGIGKHTRTNIDAAQKHGMESEVVSRVIEESRDTYSTSTPCDFSAFRFFLKYSVA